MAHPEKGKAHQGDKGKPVHLERGKVQERKLRRAEEEATCPTEEKTQQKKWKKSL